MANETEPPQKHLTRVEWIKGMHYIFISIERPVGIEEEALCTKYFALHQELTLPNEALLVDLRPAFSVPLSDDLGPKTIVAVPIGYTPPTP